MTCRCFLVKALVIIEAICVVACVYAADWPMWGCDVARSFATDEQLPDQLHLQWVVEQLPIEPAWLDEPRMQFDACYEPVAVGNTLYLNSPRADWVCAVDAATGNEKWRFYAEGPVRFAPVVVDGRVYFSSDDGMLYCLDAEDGTLLWHYNGVSMVRRVIGNKRVISSWPSRGAPVVHGGKIYFAAGIWPFMGVFVHCLDAVNGHPIWLNDGTGATFINQPHNSPAFAGVAPQGYLAISGDKLLVPGGRSVPACFDLTTGALRYYRLAENQKIGHFRVHTAGEYFLNCGNAYNTATGELVAGIGELPNFNPYAFSIANQRIPTATPDAIAQVAADDVTYGVIDGMVSAYDLAHPEKRVLKDRNGNEYTRSLMPQLWMVGEAFDRVLLKAGSRLYAAAGDAIYAVEIPQGDTQPRIVWEAHLASSPGSIIAANGRLFVSTLGGQLYCFGAEEVTTPTQIATTSIATENRSTDEWTRKAHEIMGATGVREGYCIVLGAGSGRLAEELAHQSELHVLVIDPDRQKIANLRHRLDALGLYGEHVSAIVEDPLVASIPPYMASLICSEDLNAAGLAAEGAFVQKVFQALRPYGGVACFDIPDAQRDAFVYTVGRAELANASISTSQNYTLLSRDGALPGAANWTHQYADAGNTCVSRDSAVKAPLGLLWFGGSSNIDILPRHGHGPSEHVVDGRIFLEGPDEFRALDVYTGRVLWELDLPGLGDAYNNTSHEPGANGIGTNFTTTSDALYIAYGERCIVVEPPTGAIRTTYHLPVSGDVPAGSTVTPTWGYVGTYDDLLIAGSSPLIFDGERRIGLQNNWDATCSRSIVAMNRHSGKVLWQFDAQLAFRHNTIAMGNGKLFCIDRLPDAVVAKMSRRGEEPEVAPVLYCLDVRTGQVLWQTSEDVFGTWLGYSAEYDILLQAGRPSRDMLPDEQGDRMITYQGANGKVLWDKPHKYFGPCLLHGDTIITQTISMWALGGGYSLLTGDEVMQNDPLTGEETPWRFGRNYGCNTIIGSENLLTFRSAAAGYYDLTCDAGTSNLGGFKSGCTSNLIVACGVLNAPDYTRTCTCSYQNQTSLAFVHMPEGDEWTFTPLKLTEDNIVRRVGLNMGAPGDRIDDTGMMWLDIPSVGGPSPEVNVSLSPEQPDMFRMHASRITGQLPWVGASGAEGISEIKVTLGPEAAAVRSYRVSLYFIEPADLQPAERVFDVAIQGNIVLSGVDIAALAGGTRRMVSRTVEHVQVSDRLSISLTPNGGAAGLPPVLCGLGIELE